MNTLRRKLLQTLTALPVAALAGPRPARMPALFIGHGSPMNAIADNVYTRTLQKLGRELPRPRAILVVSAHWLTQGEVSVMANAHPQTLHDFGGFPEALFAVQYPAAGHPQLATRAQALLAPKGVLRTDWGFDHGTWSVLRHLYPAADVPVFQVSIDMTQPGEYHWQIGKELSALRDEGVLIIGSGNIAHNLRMLSRSRDFSLVADQSWAQNFDDAVSAALGQREDKRLQQYLTLPGGRLAVPTPDHYWPLLYVMGAAHADGPPQGVFEGFQAGTLSMRCLRFG